MTHTPGPWEYDGGLNYGIPTESGTYYFRVDSAANARLIAAAPALLEALEMVITEEARKPALRAEVFYSVKAAIAQAKGEGK